jgi:tricorn protease-like protein
VVCVIPNKRGQCLVVEVQNDLQSLKNLGPDPLVIDAQITKDKRLIIYAVGEVFEYEDLSRFEGVAITKPTLLSLKQQTETN